MAERDGEVERVWAYGTAGQEQYGIDILVRLRDGGYEVWQTKRYRRFAPSKVKAAVKLFLKHKWSGQARKFVLVVACDLDTTGVVESIEKARDELAAKSIAFGQLDGLSLTQRLVTEPEIVDDFFGRPWVEAVCPTEALSILGSRVSRFDIQALRRSLRDCYASWISTVDPGIPIAGLDRLGRIAAALPLSRRYVQPDVLVRTLVADHASGPTRDASAAERRDQKSNAERFEQAIDRSSSGHGREDRGATSTVREQRVALDRFLAGEPRVIVIGGAGMGKSSLLRALALDILADEPSFEAVRDRYIGYVPIWVPFALWGRMAADQPTPPPIEDVVAAFFAAQNQHALGEQARKALGSSKVLLLIDGLDEANDPTTARTIAALLSAFVVSRNLPALVTSRPHALQTIGGFAGAWVRVDLAPLSDPQRHALVKVWFRIIEDLEADPGAESGRLDARAERRAKAFTSALQRNPGIGRLSQTPLFLLALMSLHRQGHQLPRSRFAAIDEIVNQLVEYQPTRRATDSLATVSDAYLNRRERDRLLDDFAFALQSGDISGAVTDAATEDAAVDRAAALLSERRGISIDEAEMSAKSVFKFAEERAGLLVKRAAANIGFLHLSIQEFLAARHLNQRPLDARIAFVKQHAAEARWREPILFLLYLVRSEAEVGELVRAIDEAPWSDMHAQFVRDALLIDAVFADLAHDPKVALGIAERLLSEAELTAWGARQRHILSSTVEGLASEAVGTLCRSRIAQWIPERHGYGRARAIRAMLGWPSSLHQSCRDALLQLLGADEDVVRRCAAEVLVALAGDDTRDKLVNLFRTAPSIRAMGSSLYALGCGWPNDALVGELACRSRDTCDPTISLEAIRLRAKRHEGDRADFDTFFKLTYDQPMIMGRFPEASLVEYFASTHGDAFISKLEDAVGRAPGRNPHVLAPLIGSLLLCDPSHPLILGGMLDLLRNTWLLAQLFHDSNFPIDKVSWSPELTSAVEAFARNEKARFIEYELYWIAKVVRLQSVKESCLETLSSERHHRYWAAKALVEFWGPHDSQVRSALLPFLEAAPEKIASVAHVLPAVVDDKELCRATLVRALRGARKRVDLCVDGLRAMGIASDDDEAFSVCLGAGAHYNSPAYLDAWREQMILTFPLRAEVRDLARAEINRRDGRIGAVAESYVGDLEISKDLLGVLRGLPENARLMLVSALQATAPTDGEAAALLEAAREDTAAPILFEAAIGWIEALGARGLIGESHIHYLSKELHAVGPDYEARRCAAVVGLALADRLEEFVQATESGKPLKVSPRFFIHEDDRALRHILRIWPQLVKAIGPDDNALSRVEITPETSLQLLDPNEPNAKQVFDLLLQAIPKSPGLSKHVQLAAFSRFAPVGELTRGLIAELLLHRGSGEYWAGLLAGELFAEHFRDEVDLRQRITEAFVGSPTGYAAGALAEFLLRKSDPTIEATLRESSSNVSYDVATHFKLVAALSSPERVLQELRDLLEGDLAEPLQMQIPRWLPAIMRRIERDPKVRESIHQALAPDTPASIKAALCSLLSHALGVDEELQAFATEELRRTKDDPVPEIGFDVVFQAPRLMRHILTEVVS